MLETPVDILLVEDNPNDVDLTVLAFKKNRSSNTIHVARDGQEALDFLFDNATVSNGNTRRAPRIILLDLKLPKVGGLEVLRRVKSNRHTRNIPVVILTSSSQDRDLSDCYALGANSFIVKPVDFSKFTECVRILGLYWLSFNHIPNP
ncbi:MAG TPA: response regulator [Verrucomicrobiae bacterium]|nr:response regulator [Verrucomicrobiae bacterium]